MDISDILTNVKDLPTLPTIYSQLLEAMSDTRTSAQDISDIIERDQASTLKLLRTVNSPVFGISTKVDTIQKAIFFLGFNEVKNIVFSLSIIDMFKNYKPNPYFSTVDHWKHSIAVGVITRILGTLINEKLVDNYFVAGIIHDIGKLLLLYHGKIDYSKVINYAVENNTRIGNAEIAVLGIDHLELGAMVAQKWDIPESLINVIKYHLQGIVNGKPDNLVACVHLADAIARALHLGGAGDKTIPRPNPEIWGILNLDIKQFSNIAPVIMKSYEDAVSILISSKGH